jgi:hypothetical protein
MRALLRNEQEIPASGKLNSDHREAIRLALDAGRAIGRPAADCLVEVQRRVQYPDSGFEQLFHRAIKDHVLNDGPTDARQAAWLRHNLFADAKITHEEQVFLREVIGEASEGSRLLLALLAEAMTFPEERNNTM